MLLTDINKIQELPDGKKVFLFLCGSEYDDDFGNSHKAIKFKDKIYLIKEEFNILNNRDVNNPIMKNIYQKLDENYSSSYIIALSNKAYLVSDYFYINEIHDKDYEFAIAVKE